MLTCDIDPDSPWCGCDCSGPGVPTPASQPARYGPAPYCPMFICGGGDLGGKNEGFAPDDLLGWTLGGWVLSVLTKPL